MDKVTLNRIYKHFKEFSFMVFVIDAQIAGVSGDMLLCSLVNIGANRSKIIDGISTVSYTHLTLPTILLV